MKKQNIDQLIEENKRLRKELKSLSLSDQNPVDDFKRIEDDKAKFEALSDATFDAVFISEKGVCIGANKAASEMFGYNYNELIGILCTDLVAHESKEVVKKNMLAGYKGPYEALAQNKNGSKFWAEFSGKMFDYHGRKIRITAVRDISERKKIEDILKDQEKFYGTLFEFSPIGIMIENKDGIIIDVNPAWSKLLGYEKNEIVGQHVRKVAHPDNYKIIDKNIKDIIAGKRLKHLLKSKRRDGSDRFIQINECAIDLPNGERGILCMVLDLTKDVQTLKNLRESEESYRNLFNNATDAIYILDNKGRFLEVNKAVEHMYGYPRDFYIGKTPRPLSAPGKNNLKNVFLFIENAFKGIPQQFEFWGKRKNGEIFPKMVRLNRGKYFGQEVIFAFAIDISELKRNEKLIKESEERFRSIVENSHAGILAVDDRFKITYANKKIEEISGYRLSEIVGSDFRQIISGNSKSEIITRYTERIKTKESYTVFEYKIITKQGKPKWIESVSSTYSDSNGKINSISQILDISDRKEFENALKTTNRNLELLNAIAHFTAMSRTPEKMSDNLVNELKKVFSFDVFILVGFYLGTTKGFDFGYYDTINGKFQKTELHDPNFEWDSTERGKKLLSEKKPICVFRTPKQVENLKKNKKWKLINSNPSATIIHVPLVIGKKVIGVISMQSYEYNLYSKEDIDLLEAVGRQIAPVVEGLMLDKKLLEQKKQLTKSEEKYRSIFNNLTFGIALIGLDGNFQIVNQRFADMVGFTIEELQKMRYEDLTHPEDIKEVRKYTIKLLNGEIDELTLENRLTHKSGKIIWIEVSIKPQHADEGEIENVLAVAQDITERKYAEQALTESEQRFRTMFSQNSAVMLLVDPEHEQKILDANKAAEDFYGYNRQALLNMKMGQINLLPKDQRKKMMQNAVSSDQNYFQFKHKLSNGNIKDVEVYASPIIQNNKKCMFVIVHDITERKKAEQEINRLATVVEQAADSIFVTDPNGDIIYVNPAFEKITGYSSQEVIGKSPSLLKNGKHNDEFFKDLWTTIRAGNKWQGILVNKRKNGNLYYEKVLIFPVKNEKGEIINFTAISRDITLERKLEQQLQQVQKMEAIGTLSGGIAHDFNNILTVINGHAEISMMNLDQTHPIYNDLLSILNAGKRAERLTSQLLAFSRKQIHELKVIDINQTIKDLDKMLRRLIPEDIEIISDFSTDLPYIKADPSQIEQIIFNLVINARDAINEKRAPAKDKKINIQTKLVDLDNVFVDMHPGSQTGQHILLSVKDTGKGMDLEIKNRIFEPFFTTKDVDKGTGLGLATVYGIVKQNDGSIYVESTPEEGSVFDIYWPVTTESPEKEYIEKINQKELSGTETILFVEDDEGVRQFACSALKSFGYKIIEAQNGKNALQLTKQKDIHIDLVITDLIMPEMNSQELANKITEFLPDLKIIFVSGYTFEHLIKDGEVEENINFLQKPYTIQNILRKIRETLDN